MNFLRNFLSSVPPSVESSDPEDYFMSIAGRKLDLAPWSDILPERYEILEVTLFGEIIVADELGPVHKLEVGAGTIEQIAAGKAEFQSQTVDDEEGWQLRPVVDRCRAAGIDLPGGHCYGFRMLPLFGGEYIVQNIYALPLEKWLSLTGEIYTQMKDLPDGVQVQFQITD